MPSEGFKDLFSKPFTLTIVDKCEERATKTNEKIDATNKEVEELKEELNKLQEHTYEIMCDLNEDVDDLGLDLSKAEDSVILLTQKFIKAEERMAVLEERIGTIRHDLSVHQANIYNTITPLIEERNKRMAMKRFFKVTTASIASFAIMVFAIYGVVQLIINLNK